MLEVGRYGRAVTAAPEPSPSSPGASATDARALPAATAGQDVRFAWAAAAAPGRRVLVVGADPGAGLLERAGAVSARAAEDARDTEPDARFDLVIFFDGLDSAPDLDLALAPLDRRLATGGLLLTALSPRAEATQRVALEQALSRRFGHFAAFCQHTLGVALVVAEGTEETATVRLPDANPDHPTATLFAASHRPIPELPVIAVPGLPSPAALEESADAASAWEERARGAEAEAAVIRWELYIVREAWRAVLFRLAELEGRPLHRLSKRVRRTQQRRQR